MAEKLSWTELRRSLASRAGVSEKTAGMFLNAFTAQLIAGLKSDKQVKINGLGTFKLQAVSPRKSVNVSTGEEITIAGYNKVVFTPEAGVKELVESGKRKVESGKSKGDDAPEIDPLKKLGEQAVEIVDLLADLGQAPNKDERLEEPIEEPVEEPIEEPVVEEPIEEKEPVDVAVETPQPAPKEPKKYHFLRDVLICVVVLLLLLFGAYFFLRSQLSSWMESLGESEKGKVKIERVQEPVVIEEEPVVVEADTVVAEEPVVEEEIAIEQEEPYKDLITIEPMHEASRLTWMSKRFYGDKRYWPYLYDANRDVIKNPCAIMVGTPIRVPKLTATQLDTTNIATKNKLQQLLLEAEEACGK